MSLWRLEWLRLVRTRRLLSIIAVFVFFGLTGPLTARYLNQIIDGLGGSGGIKVEFPEPTPADGIAQYVSNASQLGLLVVVLVAASALAFDSRREMAVFLRTRVRGIHEIVIPAYVINTGAAIGGLLAGTAAAWYETAVLLGPLPAAGMLLGFCYAAIFLAFAIAVTALVAAAARSVLATAGLSLVSLIALSIAGSFGNLSQWMPTALFSAQAQLAAGAPPTEYLPCAAVTTLATVAAVAGAIWYGRRREL